MDKVKTGLALLILVAFFLMAACCLAQSYAATPDQSSGQTVKQAPVQPVKQAPAAAVSQDTAKSTGLPPEECPEPESSFWPWKMLMRLDAWVKRNLW